MISRIISIVLCMCALAISAGAQSLVPTPAGHAGEWLRASDSPPSEWSKIYYSNIKDSSSGNSGKYLKSNGASPPSWGTISTPTVPATLQVDSGGIGKQSLTPYAVLAGGTTSTGAVQQVSGLGTSGYVLTSNGAAALPTWQAAGGGSAVIYRVCDTLSAAQVRDLNNTSVDLIPPPGIGHIAVPLGATLILRADPNPDSSFQGGGDISILVGGSTSGTVFTFDNADVNYGADYIETKIAASQSGNASDNASGYIVNTDIPFTGGGTSTVVITVVYYIANF